MNPVPEYPKSGKPASPLPDQTTREIVQYGSAFRRVKLGAYVHDYRVKKYMDEIESIILSFDIAEISELLAEPRRIFDYDPDEKPEKKDALYGTIEAIRRYMQLTAAIRNAHVKKKNIQLAGLLTGSTEQAKRIVIAGVDREMWEMAINAIKDSPLEYETIIKTAKNAEANCHDQIAEIVTGIEIEMEAVD